MVSIVNFGEANRDELAAMANATGLATWLQARARAALEAAGQG